MLTGIDPLQLSVCRLTLYRDELELSKATGFFYQLILPTGEVHTSLITNWHVLSGRNADDPKNTLSKTGALPNRLGFSMILRNNSEKEEATSKIYSQEMFISLFKQDGSAVWLQHPIHGHLIDVAAVKIGSHFDNFHITGINMVANDYDMAVDIGMDAFILGYPLGFSHFLATPIWKRATIASEPNLEMEGARGRIIVDATTRSGMSGSPVIVRAQTHYLSEDGSIKSKPRSARLIGIYSSRPNLKDVDTLGASISKSGPNAEVGYVYKSGAIDQILLGNALASDYGVLP